MAAITLKELDSFLFRGIVQTKKGSKLRDKGGLSYTMERESILDRLEAIGLDRCLYGLHSLRAGGTSGEANASVPDRMFKQYGRWRSENARRLCKGFPTEQATGFPGDWPIRYN